MRYSPYEHEYRSVNALTQNEVLEYFLTRAFEAEEIWTLSQKGDLYQYPTEIENQSSDKDIKITVPVWPYKRFAQDFSQRKNLDCGVDAESLEDFMNFSLQAFIDEGYLLEIMPREYGGNCLIEPGKLFAILEGMIDAGEYRLDG